jgi:hypothetical protein
MTGRIEFSNDVQKFLVLKGYTHLYMMGVRSNVFITDDDENENYLLVPLKKNDPRIFYEETEMLIDDINSNDVMDMAAGDEFINFIIELPIEELQEYITMNSFKE